MTGPEGRRGRFGIELSRLAGMEESRSDSTGGKITSRRTPERGHRIWITAKDFPEESIDGFEPIEIPPGMSPVGRLEERVDGVVSERENVLRGGTGGSHDDDQ